MKLEIAGQGQHNVLDEKSGLTDMIFEFDGALSVNNRGVISKIKEFDAEGITKVVLEKNNGQKYIFKASPKTME